MTQRWAARAALLDRLGDEHLVARGDHRDVDICVGGDLARPGPGRIDDERALDPSPVHLDALHHAGPHVDAGDGGVWQERRPELAGGGGIAGGDVGGLEVDVPGVCRIDVRPRGWRNGCMRCAASGRRGWSRDPGPRLGAPRSRVSLRPRPSALPSKLPDRTISSSSPVSVVNLRATRRRAGRAGS